VFYGGVSLRFRERDFVPDPEIAGDSDAAWPFGYRELEPHYAEAERILGVAGEDGGDPTDPSRSAPYPQGSADLAPVSRRLERAARALGLRPFRLPLAINRTRCLACGTCDGFACAVSAKNDLATVVIRPLLRRGLRLKTNAVVTRLHAKDGRVTGVESVHRETGKRTLHRGKQVFLAAGALATPHLLLASGLHRQNPGGHVVGRYLMRHYNEVVLGVFSQPPNPDGGFHKQLGIHDLYFGQPGLRFPRGKLGCIQQLATPPVGLVRAQIPGLLGAACSPWVKHLTGLLVIAEDQPQYENRVLLESGPADRYGLPPLRVTHRYTARDRAAGKALGSTARKILRGAGAWAFYHHRIRTFSHAVGTVRMGSDPRTSPLDPECRFRGIENLYVVDGSALPTSGGVNPSLTIAANALRAAHRLVHSFQLLEIDRYVASRH
jgi:choline dehydrogenase-like flavoprotein